jgi:hypothetical protein
MVHQIDLTDIHRIFHQTTPEYTIIPYEINLLRRLKTSTKKTIKLQEIEEGTRRQKDLPCSEKGRINIMAMAILLKAFCWFQGTYHQNFNPIFHRNRKLNTIISMEATEQKEQY